MANVFSLHDGFWEHTATLDKRGTRTTVSDHKVLITNDEEIYSFNIENCTQSEPTQLPTVQPTSIPSLHPSRSLRPPSTNDPSMTPTRSLLPSSSHVPTEICYWIEINVLFDLPSYQTTWEMKKLE